jgi:hypothetical protein
MRPFTVFYRLKEDWNTVHTQYRVHAFWTNATKENSYVCEYFDDVGRSETLYLKDVKSFSCRMEVVR